MKTACKSVDGRSPYFRVDFYPVLSLAAASALFTVAPLRADLQVTNAYVNAYAAVEAGNGGVVSATFGLNATRAESISRTSSIGSGGTTASAAFSFESSTLADGISYTSWASTAVTFDLNSFRYPTSLVVVELIAEVTVTGQPVFVFLGQPVFTGTLGNLPNPAQIFNLDGGGVANPLQPGRYAVRINHGVGNDYGIRSSGVTGYVRFSNFSVLPGSNFSVLPGSSQANPVLPTPLPPQPGEPPGTEGGQFTQQPGRRWFDPPLAQGYTFTSTGAGLFKDIMAFPVGIPATYYLITEGQTYGPFTPEDSINFLTLIGHGVSSFVLKGIKTPFVSATSPVAFPIMLDFTTETMDFTMVPILAPELQMATLPNGDVQLTFDGVLQSSNDLSGWTDVTPAPTSPFVIPKAEIGGARFFRSSKP